MNSYVPMSMPYSGTPIPYAPAPPSYAPPSYAPPSYAPPSYAPPAEYAAPQTAPIPLTPLVIPDDADDLAGGGGGGGGGGGMVTKFFALPLIVVLPILLPLLLIIKFFPIFGKKPILDKKEYEDKPYYDDMNNYQDYESNYMDDKPNKGNRQRREAEKDNKISSSSGLPSMSTAQVDRLTDVIFAAINSQECIQRLLCEAGSLSQSFSDTALTVTKAVKDFVPDSMKNSYDLFAKAEKCDQYKCGSLKVHQ